MANDKYKKKILDKIEEVTDDISTAAYLVEKYHYSDKDKSLLLGRLWAIVHTLKSIVED